MVARFVAQGSAMLGRIEAIDFTLNESVTHDLDTTVTQTGYVQRIVILHRQSRR